VLALLSEPVFSLQHLASRVRAPDLTTRRAVSRVAMATPIADEACVDCDVIDMTVENRHVSPSPFTKLMAANRAEIAVRIMRAATELNLPTVAIYGYEDRYNQHRWGADQSFLLEKDEGTSPVRAYLDIEQACRSDPLEACPRTHVARPPPPPLARCHSPSQIIKIAKENGVDAIHPGYGFLSESPEFAQVPGVGWRSGCGK
jgi:hypothetical protein